MEPATSIVKKFGGHTVVARICGVHRTRVHSWCSPKASNGSDGQIPMRHAKTLFNEAKRIGLEISAEELLGVAENEKLHSSRNGSANTPVQGRA